MMMPLYEGGWPVWVVLAFTLMGLVAALVAVVAGAGSRTAGFALAGIVLFLGMMTAFVGIGGWLYNRAQVDAVLGLVAASDVEALRAQGYAEAIWSLYCGLAGAAIPLLLGMAVFVRALFASAGPRPLVPRG